MYIKKDQNEKNYGSSINKMLKEINTLNNGSVLL